MNPFRWWRNRQAARCERDGHVPVTRKRFGMRQPELGSFFAYSAVAVEVCEERTHCRRCRAELEGLTIRETGRSYQGVTTSDERMRRLEDGEILW